MPPILPVIRRFIDPYLLLLIFTVLLAAVLPVRGVGAVAMNYVTYFAVALLFFLYGARLSPQAVIQGIMHWRLQSLVFLSTFVVFPVIGLVLTTLLGHWMTPDLVMGLMFVCVLPSTVQSSIAFTSIARGNISAALCAASISNLVGMVLTPAMVAWMLSAHGGGFSMKALLDIGLQLLLPFVAGQALRPLIGEWLLRHKPITMIADRGSILLVVYAAFSAGMVAGVWSQVSLPALGVVLVLDLVILAAVLCLTTFVSRRFGFSKEDEIAIVFCGSKKSLAGGIPMANILFPGHAVGLIVLPLMLFHQAQLFACATLARRYREREDVPAEAVPAAKPAPVHTGGVRA